MVFKSPPIPSFFFANGRKKKEALGFPHRRYGSAKVKMMFYPPPSKLLRAVVLAQTFFFLSTVGAQDAAVRE